MAWCFVAVDGRWLGDDRWRLSMAQQRVGWLGFRIAPWLLGSMHEIAGLRNIQHWPVHLYAKNTGHALNLTVELDMLL